MEKERMRTKGKEEEGGSQRKEKEKKGFKRKGILPNSV
jgi:hypothetical protein